MTKPTMANIRWVVSKFHRTGKQKNLSIIGTALQLGMIILGMHVFHCELSRISIRKGRDPHRSYSEHAHFKVIYVNQNNLIFFNGMFQYVLVVMQ